MSTRLLEKLEKCKREKDFYQAHQICRTIFVRRGSLNDESQTLNFLFDSASYFLENQQLNSGYDLCKSFVEILNKSSIDELTDDLLGQICTLFTLLRNFRDERTEFACNVLRWSTTVPVKSNQQPDEQLPVFQVESNQSFTTSILTKLTEPPTNPEQNSKQKKSYHKTGHPKLHESFAHILWETERNYRESRYHYLRSYDGQSFAIMLIEAHQSFGYPSEIDLFIAQTVLQYLLLRNFHTAYLVFVTYVENHPKIQERPPGPFSQVYPMLNFLWFLLLCLKKTLVKNSSNVASGEPNRQIGARSFSRKLIKRRMFDS